MKKTIFSIVCMVALALGMTSCGAVGIVGAVYQDTTTPDAVTANVLGSKVGQADVVLPKLATLTRRLSAFLVFSLR